LGFFRPNLIGVNARRVLFCNVGVISHQETVLPSLKLLAPQRRGFSFGSSPIAAQSGSDIEEEVPVVQKSLCHSLDDIDLVVEIFEQACV
jgi:hypothetical protein